MIVEMVIDLLKADVGSDHVADIVADRVYPTQAPDAPTYPMIIVTKVSGPGEYTMAGDARLEQARVQFDCYSDAGAAEMIRLRNAVRRLLSGFKGGIGSGGPCAIQGAFVSNELDLSDPATERRGPRLRRRMIEFIIWNSEV